ncbi:MAG: CsbD family protein [Bacillota bacterium]|nr:CsbD family protein [Bacillota bacterium]
MTTEVLKSKWKQVKGEIRTKWGRLTDDEIDEAQGNYEQLVGKLQEKYAEKKEEVKKDFDQWLESL